MNISKTSNEGGKGAGGSKAVSSQIHPYWSVRAFRAFLVNTHFGFNKPELDTGSKNVQMM